MPASATGSAARPKPKRVFVTLLFTLAVAYGVTLAVTRDSPDSAVQRAYRKLLLKVHPDKGGTAADAQKLQAERASGSAPR